MEKTFKHLALIIIIILLTACTLTKQTVDHKEKVKVDSIYLKSDSLQITSISRAIKDTIFLPVNTGEKAIDSVITKRLQHFKTIKKSGANSYGIRYDTLQKGFEIVSKIGATQNVLKKQKDSSTAIKKEQIIQKKQQTKTVRQFPFWGWMIVILLFAAVYLILKKRFKK